MFIIYKQRDDIDNGTTLFYFFFSFFRKKKERNYFYVASLKKSVHLQTKIPDGPKQNKKKGVWPLFNTPGALLAATECSTSLITIAHYMQFIVNVSTRIEREMSGRCARNVRLAAATMHTNESVHIGTRATGSVTSTRQLGRERNSIWPGLCSYTDARNE